MNQKILIIDGHPVYALKLEAFLKGRGYQDVRILKSADQVNDHLAKFQPGVVILSSTLPDADSQQILKHILQNHAILPVIVQTGLKCDQEALRAFQEAGAFRVIPRLEKNLEPLQAALSDAFAIA